MGEPLFRIIFHIDLNAFFASCEMVKRPDLKDKPLVITGEKNSKRGIVTTANYVARKFGIHSAMPLLQAKKKCPQLVVLPANFDLYRQTSQHFIRILKAYTPLVEKASIDEAYLDVTDCFKSIHPVELAQQIQQRIATELQIGCSIGIAPNKFLAKMASDMKKPNGITILRKRDLPNLLWPYPIEEMHGIGKASAPKLKKLGIETIGDLASYEDVNKLEQVFGRHSLKWIDDAKGDDQTPVDPHRYDTLSSIGHSTTFPKDYSFEFEIKNQAKLMCFKTANRLKQHQVFAKTITLQLKYSNFKQVSRSKTVDIPLQTADELYLVIEELFDEHWTGAPVRLIGVSTANFSKTRKVTEQLNLFNYQSFASEETLNQTLYQIKNKYGETIISKGLKKGEKKE